MVVCVVDSGLQNGFMLEVIVFKQVRMAVLMNYFKVTISVHLHFYILLNEVNLLILLIPDHKSDSCCSWHMGCLIFTMRQLLMLFQVKKDLSRN